MKVGTAIRVDRRLIALPIFRSARLKAIIDSMLTRMVLQIACKYAVSLIPA